MQIRVLFKIELVHTTHRKMETIRLSKGDIKWRCELMQESHAPQIASLLRNNREHILKGIQYPEEAFTDTENFVPGLIQRLKGINNFVLFDDENECIGLVGMKPAKGNSGEIGYLIIAKYEGKGLVSTTLQMVFDRVLVQQVNEEARAVEVLEIHCNVTNDRSIAVAKRFNFKRDESRDFVFKDRPSYVFILKRDEYLSTL